MYRRIMVPVDLAHAETLDKAIATAADLGKHYGATITVVGVTASGPTHAANTPKDYEQLLARYCALQGQKHGVTLVPKAIVNPDPVAELHSALREQVDAIGADLIIMASHIPSLRDYLFSSNAAYLVSHTEVSIFVVR